MTKKENQRIQLKGFNAAIDEKSNIPENKTNDYWTLGAIVLITVMATVVHHAFTT